MAWVGSELASSVRKSGRRGKVGHTAANRVDGFAQQPMMLNKEVVKWKERGDCKERRINELSLCYSLPPGVPAAGSHLGGPQCCCCLCPEGTRLLPRTGARGTGPNLTFQLRKAEAGLRAMVCPALGSCEQRFLGWQFVSMDPLQRLKHVGVYP